MIVGEIQKISHQYDDFTQRNLETTPLQALTQSPSNNQSFSFSISLYGGLYQCNSFVISGSLNYITLVSNYTFSNQDSWVGDMAFGITSNRRSIQFGGYDVLFLGVYENFKFPESWQTSASGVYNITFDISMYGLTGINEYNLCLMNAWSESQAIQYSGTVTFSSTPPLGTIPSPLPASDDDEGYYGEVTRERKYSFGFVRGEQVIRNLDEGILLNFYYDSDKGIPFSLIDITNS